MKRTLMFSGILAVGIFGSVVANGQTNDAEAGKMLIAKSDCFACHKPDGKLVGPSYLEIAKKYKSTDANVNALAGKIIKGGTGVWGQIPMAAHPKITQVDAKKMVKYILSLAPSKK